MLINPRNYRYLVGETATLRCIVYDGTKPLAEVPSIGRTVYVKIRRNSDDQYLNFTSGTWGVGGTSDYEQQLADLGDGSYTWQFDQSAYGENTDRNYTMIYTDRGETGDTSWGGADYEVYTFTTDPFTPPVPSTAGNAVVYGWLIDVSGNPLVGATVSALIDKDNIYHTTTLAAIERKTLFTKTDSTGYWKFELIPNSDIAPVETVYIITINRVDTYHIYIPSSPSSSFFWDVVVDEGWK